MKKKTVFLAGGLGNVLLQIRFAEYVQRTLNVDIYLNCTLVSPEVIEDVHLICSSKLLFNTKRFFGCYLKSRIWLALLRRLKIWPVYIEPESDLFITATDVRKYQFIVGYFQSYKYSAGRLGDFADMKYSPSVMNSNRIDKLTEKDVVVHLRFGDYLEPKAKDFHGVLGAEYYERALAEFPEINRIILITNDPILAEKVIGHSCKCPVEVWSGDQFSRIDDYFLLCSAHNLIIGNSSFSYCAALYAWRERSARVVAPKNWFSSKPCDTELRFPENWLKV